MLKCNVKNMKNWKLKKFKNITTLSPRSTFLSSRFFCFLGQFLNHTLHLAVVLQIGLVGGGKWAEAFESHREKCAASGPESDYSTWYVVPAWAYCSRRMCNLYFSYLSRSDCNTEFIRLINFWLNTKYFLIFSQRCGLFSHRRNWPYEEACPILIL